MTQLPSPQHGKRLRPRTYSVAVYLVVTIVILQGCMLLSVFWLRAMVVSVKTVPPAAQAIRPGQISPNPQPLPGPPKPDADLPPPPLLPSISGTVASPRLTVPGVSDRLEQIGNLNDQAENFIHQRAMASAAEVLIKAEDLDPRNPTTLKNLAEASNLMNDPVRARVFWQRLVDLGPAVGTIYAVAKDHVILLEGSNSDPLNMKSPLPRLIYIANVEKTPVDTVNGKAQFRMQVVLRKNAKLAQFDQKKLQPYVIFYQQLPDGSLVPDLGQQKGAFEDTFLFWNNKRNEGFNLDYLMPVPGALGSNNTTMGDYYGFVIGIYYDKELQDVRSEPSDLVNRIPLPREIE